MGTTRLEWAKGKVERLLDEAEADPVHRIGLMPFAGEAFLLLPPTPDYEAVRFFLEDLNPASVALGGSDLAEAIDEAAEELRSAARGVEGKPLPGRKAILVVSDGDLVDPRRKGALDAAREAAREKAVSASRDARLGGVAVYALGVGKRDEASEVTVPDDRGGTSYVRYRDESGNEVIATSRLRESTLAAIASPPGAYAHSTLDGSDIELLLSQGLLSGEVAGEGKTERSLPLERFRWPLLAAFILLLVELFVPEGRRPEGRGEAAV
jgi:Ca-activated chloride channel family protein